MGYFYITYGKKLTYNQQILLVSTECAVTDLALILREKGDKSRQSFLPLWSFRLFARFT